MACLDMYNSDHKGHHHCSPMSPRISFSNDFVDLQQSIKLQEQQQQRPSRSDSSLSSDFEFSVTNHSMISPAEDLFFKGRLLPYKDKNLNNSNNQIHRATTTLKDELLLNDDHDYDDFSLRPPKGSSTRWKGFLGLRKSHIGSKKAEKSHEGSSDRGVEQRRSSLIIEGAPINNITSQELLNEGGSSCMDLEIGI